LYGSFWLTKNLVYIYNTQIPTLLIILFPTLTDTEIPQLGKTKSASGIIFEKFEIAEWNGCQIVTFNVLNDLNKVVNEFSSISTLFMV
jgi:hypothetical protein